MKQVFSIVSALTVMAAASAAEPLLRISEPRHFTAPRYFKKVDDGSLRCLRNCYAVSRKKVPVDPAKKYRVSGEIKGSGNVRVGVSPFTAAGISANIAGLQPITGTEAVLIAPTAQNDKSFKVKDASSWQKTSSRVVFDADTQGRDLPNYNFFGGRVKSITKEADGYLITMTGTIGVELTPGACVRQHREGRAAIFGKTQEISGKWQQVEFILGPGITPDGRNGAKIYPGTTQVAIWISVPKDACIRNFQIEEIQ